MTKSLLHVIRETVQLTKGRGGTYSGRCPFHDDAGQSLRATTSLFHCFGCHVGGDAYSFVMRRYGATYAQAKKYVEGGGPRAKPGERAWP